MTKVPMNKLPLLASTVLAGCIAMPAFAATPVQQEPGVSGFFQLGVGVVSAETNMIATTFGGMAEIGDDTIDDPTDSPDSETAGIPIVALSVAYTFENKATELFFGSSLEDFLQFDFATVLGLRHQVDDVGIFEVAAVGTPLATEVWEDPYVVGAKRDETDRTTNGIRLQWGAILGSGFDVRVTSREVDIDKERSGDALVANATITAAEQKLLDRNGDINVIGVVYNWNIAEGRILSVGVNSVEHDLDGDAMSYDGASVQATYATALDDRNRLVSNVFVGSYEFDKTNPIYDEKDEMDQVGLTVTYFRKDAFGFKDWSGNIAVVYADSDHDIDFYDTTAAMVSVGMLRRF
ncbi:MAG: DUF2860 family protein [Gammaproteobacteria bacterium]|nr:MAG: DUF2860 domain-containing protein [Gammaproteobacteria bacterium]UCH38579.1 MAG: DUF2860 family protein [Gammaproteobacteria bacterium]